MKSEHNYKVRKVCPWCLSLSFKKSYKVFKCDNCKEDFEKPIEVLLMHKNNRCIDNDVRSRIDRLRNDKVIYCEA